MNCVEILINLLLAFAGVVGALWYENLGSPSLLIEDANTTDDKKDKMGRARCCL
jgi:hypothetical protein